MTAPDERVFREHLAGARFLDGVERGRWRLVGEVEWPTALLAVSAAPRPEAPNEFYLRVDSSGCFSSAPTATPWDPAVSSILAANLRPKGERVGHVFRHDWEGGRALYAPFDRVALSTHPGWAQRYPRQSWNPSKDLTWFLQQVFELLNDDDYVGV